MHKDGSKVGMKHGEDCEYEHEDYAGAMGLRSDIHNSLTDADYRRGYVSTEESPGVNHVPVTTYRASYSHIENPEKRGEMIQTLDSKRGKGKTSFVWDKQDRSPGAKEVSA